MTREEIKDIVRLSVTELDLQTTKEIGELTISFEKFKASVPEMIAAVVEKCRVHQNSRRRWNISTMIALAALAVSGCAFIATHWPL